MNSYSPSVISANLPEPFSSKYLMVAPKCCCQTCSLAFKHAINYLINPTRSLNTFSTSLPLFACRFSLRLRQGIFQSGHDVRCRYGSRSRFDRGQVHVQGLCLNQFADALHVGVNHRHWRAADRVGFDQASHHLSQFVVRYALWNLVALADFVLGEEIMRHEHVALRTKNDRLLFSTLYTDGAGVSVRQLETLDQCEVGFFHTLFGHDVLGAFDVGHVHFDGVNEASQLQSFVAHRGLHFCHFVVAQEDENVLRGFDRLDDAALVHADVALRALHGFLFQLGAAESRLRSHAVFFHRRLAFGIENRDHAVQLVALNLVFIGRFVAFDGDDAQTIECDQVTSKSGRLGDFFGGHRNVFYAFDGGLVEH